jgi:gluconate 5-dehydrogenase
MGRMESTIFDLTGRTALVTGAGRGIGLALARGLAQHGANAALVARTADQLEMAKDEIEAGTGRIINIASLSCHAARPTIAAYTASKMGLLGLTRTLAVEWAGYGINVNGIGPGHIATDLTTPLQADPQFNQWVLSKTPLGRWSRPEDLIGVAVLLASHAGDFITGQILCIDGGWTAMV